jgi:hypothetical protein
MGCKEHSNNFGYFCTKCNKNLCKDCKDVHITEESINNYDIIKNFDLFNKEIKYKKEYIKNYFFFNIKINIKIYIIN